MTNAVQQTAAKLPFEITEAISAFDNETRQAVVITLLNEGQLRFSELRERLSDEDTRLHNQTLTNSLEKLQAGGLINKRIAELEGETPTPYYEVSEYGERFVDCLLNSLGAVNDPGQHQPRYERVEHIHHGDGEVAIEGPVDLGTPESAVDEAEPPAGQ